MAPQSDDYTIRYTPAARRALARISEKVRPALFEMIEGPIANNPRRVGKPLGLELTGRWAARRDVYRIVYEINDDSREVAIVNVAHRRDAYRG